jgi:hypothetical protein
MATSIKGNLTETMDAVANTLKFAGEHGLETEVIATAMLFLKENPDAEINEALNVGLSDWDV